jgi:type III pantothenate kinase
VHSYIVDWLKHFSDSEIIFTGGDGELLWRFLQQQFPDLATQATVDLDLVFKGIRLVYEQQDKKYKLS